MSDISWNLLDQVNLKVAWRLVSKDMSKSFFNSRMVTVPHIEEAVFYDLMVCFTKKNAGMLEKLAKVGPEYHLHGHIADLVKVYTEDGNPKTNMQELLYTCQHPSEEQIETKGYRKIWEEGEKSITVEMSDLSKLVTNWAAISEGSLVIDNRLEDLQDVKNVFIISEVIYADKISVDVRVGAARLSDEILVKTPVAFSYMKFPVDKLGVLQPAKDTKLKISAYFHLVEEEDKTSRGLGGTKTATEGMRTRSKGG